VSLKRVCGIIASKWRILLIVLVPAAMIVALGAMLPSGSAVADNGRADLSNINFSGN
jgi:hypothetical protein